MSHRLGQQHAYYIKLADCHVNTNSFVSSFTQNPPSPLKILAPTQNHGAPSRSNGLQVRNHKKISPSIKTQKRKIPLKNSDNDLPTIDIPNPPQRPLMSDIDICLHLLECPDVRYTLLQQATQIRTSPTQVIILQHERLRLPIRLYPSTTDFSLYLEIRSRLEFFGWIVLQGIRYSSRVVDTIFQDLDRATARNSEDDNYEEPATTNSEDEEDYVE